MAQPSFVVGSGRCGSTLLSNQLASHPSIALASELSAALGLLDSMLGSEPTPLTERLQAPNPIAQLLVAHNIRVPEFINPAPNQSALMLTAFPVLFGDTAHDALKELVDVSRSWNPATDAQVLQHILDWISHTLPDRTVVERSGASLRGIAELTANFATARFVHVHRSGVETARSMHAHPVFKLDALRHEGFRQLGVDMFAPELTATDRTKLDQLFPGLTPWSFSPEQFDESFPIPLTYFALAWSFMMTNAARKLAQLPRQQVLHISYRELVDDPSQTLRRVAQHLEIDPSERWLQDAGSLVRPATPTGEIPHDLERACRLGERLRLDLARR